MAICKQKPKKMIVNLYELKKKGMLSDICSGYYEGINRIFNHHNLYSKYRIMLASDRSDYLSVLSDWENVGVDLSKAIKDYELNHLGEHSDWKRSSPKPGKQ